MILGKDILADNIFFLKFLLSGFGFRGLVCFGHTANPMDISHHFSGTVFGFVNGIGCVSGFITPIVTAYFTEDNPKDPTNWQKVINILTYPTLKIS